MFSFLKNNPRRIAMLLLLALGYRFWFCTTLELIPDEAYYWLWSKHLAASYRDKGPGIAWTIALGTEMFGNTVFGIRFFAVLLSIVTSWLMFVLTRRLYDDRAALWCLIVIITMPLLAVGSILMTIDSLSLFFWVLGLIIFWNALQSGKTVEWFLLGAVIGLGFLAKFTNGVQLGCIGLFLLWSKEHRRLLFSWKMVALVCGFVLFITPILWWNMETGWIHYAALHSRSGVKSSFQFSARELLTFVGGQFGVLSPVIAAGMAVAAVALMFKKPVDLRTRFLLSHFLPVYGVFLFFSLNEAGKPNWTAPALVTGIIFTVVFWQEMIARVPAWRWGSYIAFAIAIVMTVGLHATAFLDFPAGRDPMHKAKGWTDFAAHVQKARVEHKADLLLATHYSVASEMSFYLPDQPVTYLPPERYGRSQFSLWPGYEVPAGRRALLVTQTLRPIPKPLAHQFSKIEVVDDFWSEYRGQQISHFQIYLLQQE